MRRRLFSKWQDHRQFLAMVFLSPRFCPIIAAAASPARASGASVAGAMTKILLEISGEGR
jgi:hypothetical protein